MLKCIYCDCDRFITKDGTQMCMECGSHQINFLELVEDEEAWDLNRSRFYINPKSSEKRRIKPIIDIPLTWSYYEAYNMILKQWTDILIQLGASKKYQETVFKLWVLYLQKRNMAFKHDLSDDKPRGGDGIFDRRDLVTLKGAVIESPPKKVKEKEKPGSLDAVKNKIEKKKMKMKNPNSNLRSYVIAGQMNETLKSMNSFVEHEEMEISESAENEDMDETQFESKSFMEDENMLSDVTDDDDDDDDESHSDKDDSQKSEKMVVNMKYKKRLSFSDIHNLRIDFLIFSPLYLNLPKLLSFLYLPSLITQEEILLMDILRWCREDFIPYQSAAYVLPRNMLKDVDDETVFNRYLPQAAEVRYHSGSMAIYLSLQHLPLHSLELVINKIVDTLKLPDDVRDVGLTTFRSVMRNKHNTTSVPSVEVAAAAAIILVLKVTYGMDNYHEEKLSDFADTFNKIFEAEGKSYRVFSWRKWHKYINRTRYLVNQVGIGINSYSRDDNVNIPIDSKRLSSYFWAKGAWKTPIGKDNVFNKDQWDTHLLKSTLGLNLQKLKKVVEEEYLFEPHSLRYWGIVKQYLHKAHIHDKGRNNKELIEIAKKLDEASFSSHRFNWLLHRYEIVAEFYSLKKEIDIVKIPVCSSKEVKKIVTKSKEKEYVDIFYVPDPLKSFWKAENKTLKECPTNFQWLVKVMSEICEADEDDIYKRYLKQEATYLSVINSTKEKLRISIGEGEDARDL